MCDLTGLQIGSFYIKVRPYGHRAAFTLSFSEYM